MFEGPLPSQPARSCLSTARRMAETCSAGDPELCHLRGLNLGELGNFFFFLPEEEPVCHDTHDERKQDHVRRAEKGHFFSHCLRHGGAGIHVGVCHVHQESVERKNNRCQPEPPGACWGAP